jgi:hypothetical protein
MMGFRAAPDLRASIVRWAEYQPDQPTLSEATRRLVELGLTVKQAASPSPKAAARAADLAAKAIEKHIDPSTPTEERETRKRKLIQGPGSLREGRKDRAK